MKQQKRRIRLHTLSLFPRRDGLFETVIGTGEGRCQSTRGWAISWSSNTTFTSVQGLVEFHERTHLWHGHQTVRPTEVHEALDVALLVSPSHEAALRFEQEVTLWPPELLRHRPHPAFVVAAYPRASPAHHAAWAVT